MKRLFVSAILALAAFALGFGARDSQPDPRLKNASRMSERNGWVQIHLEGSPAEIGYQHGFLLAREIEDAHKAIRLSLTHDSKDWAYFREAAEKVLWPHVEAEYRAELQGIVEGLHAKGSRLDLWDMVAGNAWLELSPYYVNWKDKQKKQPTPEHCSAFVATGSYTRDGKPVIAHNNWTDYVTGTRWNIVFDITPAAGHRFIMDGMPGLIHSGDDFGLNAAGLMITETTISQFNGFDPNGIPEFVRARKAMQYSGSIDDFVRIMKDGNNGGYANDWLVADRNTGEIASVELGLKNVNVKRTRDGYFVGSNYPIDPKLAKEETDFDVKDMGLSANARHVRWDQLMAENKGKIDVAAAQRFLADHFDSFDKKTAASERTLCGHVEASARGSKPWQPAYGAAGSVQNKAADATMASTLSFTAALGHACGTHFKAGAHLKAHPEFAWQRELLRDMDSRGWTVVRAK
jgi:hypothetical protein